MASAETKESPLVARVMPLVTPIVDDLQLELYDCEYAGGVLKVTIDTPAGSPGGVDLDVLALATRLISRELDHVDPIPGHYTLEVTSPGVERVLRRPEHFRRELGKEVAVRLHNVVKGERRVQGSLVAADEEGIVVVVAVGSEPAAQAGERHIPYDQIDRARTVFVWGPAPKPGQRQPERARPATKEAPAS